MLKGENIRLRTIEPNDIDVLLAWENNTKNWRVSNTFVPFSRKLMEEYIFSAQDIFSNKQIRFIIEDLKTKESLGCVDLFDYDPFHLRAGVGVLIDEKSGSASELFSGILQGKGRAELMGKNSAGQVFLKSMFYLS